MTVCKADKLCKVITKLDDVELELLRLRAALLPEERVTARERKVIARSPRDSERSLRHFRSA